MEHQNIGLKLPANVEMFLEQVTSLIEFDVLKPDVLLPIFGVNKTVEEIIGMATEEKTHDGKTVIQQLQLWIFIIVGGVSALLIVLPLLFFKKIKEKLKPKLVKSKKDFFWNGAIAGLIFSYIEHLKAGTSAIMTFLKGQLRFSEIDSDQKTNLLVGIAIYLLVIVAAIVITFVVNKHKKNYLDPDVI